MNIFMYLLCAINGAFAVELAVNRYRARRLYVELFAAQLLAKSALEQSDESVRRINEMYLTNEDRKAIGLPPVTVPRVDTSEKSDPNTPVMIVNKALEAPAPPKPPKGRGGSSPAPKKASTKQSTPKETPECTNGHKWSVRRFAAPNTSRNRMRLAKRYPPGFDKECYLRKCMVCGVNQAYLRTGEVDNTEKWVYD